MNFVKVGNLFVNLREVESFEVYAAIESVDVRFVYRSGRQDMAHVTVDNDDPSCILDTEAAVEAVAGALYDAILSCADADCEDIADYVDYN